MKRPINNRLVYNHHNFNNQKEQEPPINFCPLQPSHKKENKQENKEKIKILLQEYSMIQSRMSKIKQEIDILQNR